MEILLRQMLPSSLALFLLGCISLPSSDGLNTNVDMLTFMLNPAEALGSIIWFSFGKSTYILYPILTFLCVNSFVFKRKVTFDSLIIGVLLTSFASQCSLSGHSPFSNPIYGGVIGTGIMKFTCDIPLVAVACIPIGIFGLILILMGCGINLNFTRYIPVIYKTKNLSPAKINTVKSKTHHSSSSIAKSTKQKNNYNNTLPDISIIGKPSELNGITKHQMEYVKALGTKLIQVLEEFNIQGKIIRYTIGPVITQFEFEPASGIKINRIISLNNDIARALSAISVMIYLIPGKTTLGIEIPNRERKIISLPDVFDREQSHPNELTLFIGTTVDGAPFLANLINMPHLLMAGATGSGKSVGLNVIISSILLTKTPEECLMIMIDPKMLELSVYNNIPHLAMPVITDTKLAIKALKWLIQEMENRYKIMSTLKVRNISSFNNTIESHLTHSSSIVVKTQEGFNPETKKPITTKKSIPAKKIPRIVLIIDELADLMITAGKEVEGLIQRLAQMARAAGIHMIVATQRPSVDVITGTIKANFPTRMSFHLTTKIDSRTILGTQGAEQLLGNGDMLYMFHGKKPIRIHVPYISDSAVKNLTEFLGQQQKAQQIDLNEAEVEFKDRDSINNFQDDMLHDALAVAKAEKKISASYLQRKLRIGYNRAARIIEHMVELGILGEPDKTGKRKLIHPDHEV